MHLCVLCFSTCLVLSQKTSNMPTVEHETSYRQFDCDVEIRIRRFGNLTIVALCNCIILIALIEMLRFWIEAVPDAIPISFSLRWACIVCLWLCTITVAKTAMLSQIFIAIRSTCMSEIEDEKCSQNRDLEARTTKLEDWILAHFCAIVALPTLGFVAWYWIKVIELGVCSFFYWTCTMSGLFLLFCLLARTLYSYRQTKGIKYDEPWGTLVGVIVLRLYDKAQELNTNGRFGQLIKVGRFPLEPLATILYIVGFQIGRGPLFDRLPEEWKAARRACKTQEEVANWIPPVSARRSDKESGKKEDPQDRNDTEEAFFHPSVFEWQPNPVMFPPLRDEHLQSLDPGPSILKDTLDCHLMDTADTTGAAGGFSPGMAVDFDDTSISENNQMSPSVPRHTGPATLSANLSSFACPQCSYVAKKKHKLNKHITQTHDRPFRCDYHGCGKTFGLRAHLERHEATHRQREGFKCPNSWCKIPEMGFTREDNLQRHMRQCVNF